MRVGPWELLEPIGRGATATVFRARGPDGREVAVKLLQRAKGDAALRFDRERRLLATLGEEEGIVPLIDSGDAPAGRWLAMPFLRAGSLRPRLRSGPLPIDEVRALGIALAGALARAHALGVVHRDVKPENVLFADDGRPLLADLGLAKHFDRAAGGAESVSLSRTGELRGTAGYAPLEQLRDARSAGPAADVFALGAVLYECLAGAPVFEGSNAIDVFKAIEAGRFVPLRRLRPEVPAELARTIERALAPEAKDRFADGAALARALVSSGSRRRSPGVVLAIAIVALVLGGAAALVVRERRRAREAAIVRELEHVKQLEKILDNDERFAAMIAALTKVTVEHPDDPRAWIRRGQVRAYKGDRRGALADYDRALELLPDDLAVLKLRASARAYSDDHAGAVSDYARILALDPKDALTWRARARVRWGAGDVRGAADDFWRAGECDPKDSLAFAGCAEARENLGDREGAIEAIGKVLAIEPGNAVYWVERGRLRLAVGRLAPALADLDEGIRLDPNAAQAFALRALVRLRLGDRARAREDFDRALALDPKEPTALANRDAAR